MNTNEDNLFIILVKVIRDLRSSEAWKLADLKMPDRIFNPKTTVVSEYSCSTQLISALY